MKKSGEDNQLSITWEIVGWYGALAILGAYFSVSFGLISPEGLFFQFLNISGALGLLFISWKKKVYQNMALNVVWIIIGIVALIEFVL